MRAKGQAISLPVILEPIPEVASTAPGYPDYKEPQLRPPRTGSFQSDFWNRFLALFIPCFLLLTPSSVVIASQSNIAEQTHCEASLVSIGLGQINADENRILDLISKYTDALGLFHNPFALPLSTERTQSLFQRMLVQKKGEQWVNSPLAIINLVLNNFRTKKKGYNSKLISWLFIETKREWEQLIEAVPPSQTLHQFILQSPRSKILHWQAQLLALRYGLEYLQHFKTTSPHNNTTRHSNSEPETNAKTNPEPEAQIEPEPPTETAADGSKNATNPQQTDTNAEDSDQGSSLQQSGNRASHENESSQPESQPEPEPESQPSITEESAADESPSNEVEWGSLSLNPKVNRNILLERIIRKLFQIALDPTQNGANTQNVLHTMSSLMRRFPWPAFVEIYRKSLVAHQKYHPDLKRRLEHLSLNIATQDLNKTYEEVHTLLLALEVYHSVIDHDANANLNTHLENVITTLKQIQSQLKPLAHPASGEIALVHDFVNRLPAVARMLLKEKFGLVTIGANPPTRLIAHKLRSGDLNDLRLMAHLTPMSAFILSSTPRPEYLAIRTWTRDYQHPRGRDLLPTQRASDLMRIIRGQAGKSVLDNMREGTAFVAAHKKRMMVSAGHGKEEAERITIVLYDTSASMHGDLARFQAGLISAFSASALSDFSPSGKHRHRVLLVPFDENPGAPVAITNTNEALTVLQDYQNYFKNTGAGTNIQKALLQAMKIIADAEERSGEPLSSANIILMTDGQSEVNAQELRHARNTIDRRTPLQVMFVALAGSNDDLVTFARESESIGAEQGFYREFSKDSIREILNISDSPTLDSANQFYTEHPSQQVPETIIALVKKAYHQTLPLIDCVFSSQTTTSEMDLNHVVEQFSVHASNQVLRPIPLEEWLIQIRQLMPLPIFQDHTIRMCTLGDLFKNFELLTRISIKSLSNFEQAHLRHLLRGSL